MAAASESLGARAGAALRVRGGRGLARGLVVTYLSLIVLLPLAVIAYHAAGGGWSGFWQAVTNPETRAAIEFTFQVALLVAAVNAVAGTLIAWVLVRDQFPGRGFVNSLIDLPFALPTIVAGMTLLALYGPQSPVHLDLAFTRPAVVVALLFETLPFVVRSVQPVLLGLDPETEEAAHSLGANRLQSFRRIVLPILSPAILSGVALAFARSMGEFGSVILISGNLPFKTEVASLNIYNQVESDNLSAAAAEAIVLLVVALAVLLALSLAQRRSLRHDG